MSKVLHGRRLCIALLCMVLCMTLIPQEAWAYTDIDTSRDSSITLRYHDRETALSNVTFSVYKVADVSPQAVFTPDKTFTDYGIDFNVGKEQWTALSQTLTAYIIRDDIQPVQSQKTDAEGRAVFSPLKPGLYLVAGEKFEYGGYTYKASPFLISLPNLNEGNVWNYDVTSSLKFEKNPVPPDVKVKREVIKVWKDKGGEKDRPKDVVVQLLGDGKVYDTVTLNADNDWWYRWDDLSADKDWQIVEKDVPDDYKVVISQEGDTFVITNTWDKKLPPDEGTFDENSKKPKEELPYTGQLWWPVPLLSLAGLVAFLLGLISLRKTEK